jgi:hypothetical protein
MQSALDYLWSVPIRCAVGLVAAFGRRAVPDAALTDVAIFDGNALSLIVYQLCTKKKPFLGMTFRSVVICSKNLRCRTAA